MNGIYKIVNLINEKYYVGSSNKIERRWRRHLSDLKKNKHVNPKLQNAWNFHGENNFKFQMVETFNDISPTELKVIEDRYLLICQKDPESNYNCNYTSIINKPRDETVKNKIRESMKKVIRTKEWCEKIGEANRKRGRLSDVSIQKMREKLTGRKMNEETKKKLSLSRLGKPCSRSDMSIRTFQNVTTNQIVTLPTFQFKNEYSNKGLNKKTFYRLLKGQPYQCGEWKVISLNTDT